MCSNLPMITVSLGIYSSTAGDNHLKNVGSALDFYIKDGETGLISIQVLLLAFAVQLQRDLSGRGSLPSTELQAKMRVKIQKKTKNPQNESVCWTGFLPIM